MEMTLEKLDALEAPNDTTWGVIAGVAFVIGVAAGAAIAVAVVT